MKHLTKLMMVLVLLSGSANAFFFDIVSLNGTQTSTESTTGGMKDYTSTSCAMVGLHYVCPTVPLGKQRYTKNSMRLSANRLADDGYTNEFEISLDLSNDTDGLTDYTVSATYTWSFNK